MAADSPDIQCRRLRSQNYLYFQHYANSAGIVEPRVQSFLGRLPALPRLRLAVLDLVSDSFVSCFENTALVV